MNGKSPRRPFHAGTLITALLGAASLGYVFLVFLPVQKSIGRIRQEIQSKRDFVMQTSQLSLTIADAKQRLQQTADFNRSRQQATPHPGQLSAFYASVLDAAQEAGVKTIRFDPGSPLVLETLQKHPLEMEIAGTFAQVFQFHRQLEQSPTPVWLEELNIEPLSEDREVLQCEIKMVVFAARTENSD